MSFRVPPALKLLMDRAAAASGRSVAQEIELQLQQSFRDDKLMADLLAAARTPVTLSRDDIVAIAAAVVRALAPKP